MSPQGDRHTADEDDWWDRLYDGTAPDTAPSASGDTLDDRFHSATGTFTTGTAVTAPDAPPGPPPAYRPAAPWEPRSAPGPRTFPGGPRPPAVEQAPPPAEPAARDPRAVHRPGDTRAGTGEGPRPVPHARAPQDAPEPFGPVAREVPRAVPYVGDGPPTYDAEPTALPPARAHELDEVVPDTVLDGARYGTFTLRAASVRGDSARYRGEPRRDVLLTARFGTGDGALLMAAVATGTRAAEGSHLAARDACRWIGEAVGRSHARLAEDIGAGRREDLKSGLHRLTDRTYGRLRARAAELGLESDAYTADLRCLLLTADSGCRTRIFFGVGGGGLFRLRDGAWHDLEPSPPEPGAVTGEPVVGYGSPAGASPPVPAQAQPPSSGAEAADSGPDRLTMRLGVTPHPGAPYIEDLLPPPAVPFRFRASVARPGDTLLLAGAGLAEPLRCEPALAAELAARWAVVTEPGTEPPGPPGLAAFLSDTQLRVKGYADDRTAVAVWEA
ncbi:protein phosphatase 2C domain-containing protein [Streptomyces sp. MUM 203J]|uniref:protein phosphatase 2C domain-containing protein n=1 Tax=Streptomyces sp. MUM 203J TaxID=2791990 RepID=UPI001F035AE2|nr:protein phosphatase 2C domain-containing protein [Streptomyces sp. MUM 203J]MCH0541548.1 protein phosphatase 2C domain-containing protein [Streptomyces sp. MUM 203J]